jgi:hypothetical protein
MPNWAYSYPEWVQPTDSRVPSPASPDALLTRTQQRVFALLFGQPARSSHAAELSGLASMGSGAVQRELATLAGSGLVTVPSIGNHKRFDAVSPSSFDWPQPPNFQRSEHGASGSKIACALYAQGPARGRFSLGRAHTKLRQNSLERCRGGRAPERSECQGRTHSHHPRQSARGLQALCSVVHCKPLTRGGAAW